MIDENSAIIKFAAKFEVEELDITFLQSDSRQLSRLFIQVKQNRFRKNSPLNVWENKGKGQPNYIFPSWDNDKNPWDLLSYIGPLKKQTKIGLQINDIYKTLIEVKKHAEKIPLFLLDIFDLYSFPEIEKEERTALKALLDSIVKKAVLTNFVDGFNSEASTAQLTLANAQQLAKKVRNSDQLDNKDHERIKILLTKAPLQFGYWGPFKTLMKYLDPKLLPEEFGEALGRLAKLDPSNNETVSERQRLKSEKKPATFQSTNLSRLNPSDWGFWPKSNKDSKVIETTLFPYENISWLKTIFAIPSRQTIFYMRRRMRRVLDKLGQADTSTYARIASNALITFDKKIDKQSFIPAFILCGSSQFLNKTSRIIKLPLDQNKRCDPYPDAWDENLDLIKKIINSINNSPEIIIFCLQVLSSNGVRESEIDDLKKRHKKLIKDYLLNKKSETTALSKKKKVQGKKTSVKPYKSFVGIEPISLGEGVSNRLTFSLSNDSSLKENKLPIIHYFHELASLLDIETSELTWLTYERREGTVDHYTRFTIPKRTGGTRTISSPKSSLRNIQKWVLHSILDKIPVHSKAMAFRPKVSIVDNASIHKNSQIVVRIDLEDFFPSITFPRIRGFFESVGYNPGIATVLALICSDSPKEISHNESSYHYRATGPRSLPQGACTSPALANLITRNLDNRLQLYVDKAGWTYSRYADDLVFSTKSDDASPHRLTKAIEGIVRNEGFKVNQKKTRVMRSPNRQTVTGLLVNKDVRISRKDLRRLRAFLHRCSTKGIENVSKEIGKDALSVAKGHIAYINMISPLISEKLIQKHQWLK